MKPNRSEPETQREDSVRRASPSEPGERRQIFLRTLYPLNPGIPHYVDFPKGWE